MESTQMSNDLKTLKVDDKWSVFYDAEQNDRPLEWYRHEKSHSPFSEFNADVAMFYALKEATDRTEELEAENEKLRLGLEVYSRERDRYKHNKPEISGAYFLSGGHGQKDDNMMPQFVEICPAYGCAWVMIYEDTGRTISYEGS